MIIDTMKQEIELKLSRQLKMKYYQKTAIQYSMVKLSEKKVTQMERNTKEETKHNLSHSNKDENTNPQRFEQHKPM